MTEATSFWGGGGAGLGVVKAGTKGLTVVATKSLTVLTTLLKKDGDSLLPLNALNGFLGFSAGAPGRGLNPNSRLEGLKLPPGRW